MLKMGREVERGTRPKTVLHAGPQDENSSCDGWRDFLLLKTTLPMDTCLHPPGEGTKMTSCGSCSKVGSGGGIDTTKINPVTQASWHPWAQIHQLIPFKVKITDSIFLSFIVVKSSPPCFHSHIRLETGSLNWGNILSKAKWPVNGPVSLSPIIYHLIGLLHNQKEKKAIPYPSQYLEGPALGCISSVLIH